MFSLATLKADQNLDLTAAVHSRGVIDKDDFRHTDPSSPDNTSSRDDTEIKVKKKATRGRPPNSQRKSARRIQAPTVNISSSGNRLACKAWSVY